MSNSSKTASQPIHLLYIEDDDLNWEIVSTGLRDPFRVDRAKTDMEAFISLRRRSYDAILVDIELEASELNGIDIVKVLRGQADHIPEYAQNVSCGSAPIIIVTGHADAFRRGELISHGADDVVVKPIDFSELTSTVRRVIFCRAP